MDSGDSLVLVVVTVGLALTFVVIGIMIFRWHRLIQKKYKILNTFRILDQRLASEKTTTVQFDDRVEIFPAR